MAIALAFGLTALRYPIGDLSRAGPGLFPVMVSSLRLDLHFKNIALILGSLCGFALISMYLDMVVGIVFMVFCSAFAGSSNSWVRNVKISAGLITMAFALQKLLGLNLPLF
jgi:hypothetical protein